MEGGLEEFVEFLPRRCSNSAIRRWKELTKAETAACASAGNPSQSG